jgi:hypothetical protein
MAESPDPSCILLIPIYKPELDPFEAFNVWLTERHAGGLERKFFGPERLDRGDIAARFPGFGFAGFAGRHFASRSGYNDLLRSAAFYRRFEAYDYMLIVQPDAFLVADPSPALGWGYDFVGAPWPEPIRSWLNHFDIRGRPRLAQLLRRARPARRAAVGNGGLSLRRVARFRELCEAHGDFRAIGKRFIEEDLVFAYFGMTGALRVPSPEIAARFACEWEAYGLDEAPETFGFHALAMVNLALYLKIRARHLVAFRTSRAGAAAGGGAAAGAALAQGHGSRSEHRIWRLS